MSLERKFTKSNFALKIEYLIYGGVGKRSKQLDLRSSPSGSWVRIPPPSDIFYH